ncbi:Strictosidine synthase [Melia azedarach]|uniref:Strictosidine synthase n=1 Tax=Melia azedarach TaxID=155640 RepID=A0ACC1XBU4_MELAZ|nr:Strictosidine synthase [Melia azedarach]
MAPKVYPPGSGNSRTSSKRCCGGYMPAAACSGFILACLLGFTLQIFFFSPISPDELELPLAVTSSDLFPTNSYLQSVIKLGEGLLKGPEDVCIDRNGVLYTASRDGWIKRLHRNGTWENWKFIDSHTLLGLTITTTKDHQNDDLVVCDTKKGLLKISEEAGVTVLASHVNGSKISFADDVIAASDGNLYFSVASTKFGPEDWYLDLLEAKPHGQLLKYDPSLNETSILLDGLGFANGVALSRDEDYLVVCETWKFRCLKYWLKGKSKGKTEIFIENLPGGPDNIKLAPDGSFWIALIQLSSRGLEFVHTSKATKQLIASFPKMIKLFIPADRKATVINVAPNGNIIRKFDDPTGNVMSLVTSALEFDDNLYLGSLNSNFIGKLPLKNYPNPAVQQQGTHKD